MLLGTLGARLLGNILTGQEINWAGEGIVRAGYGNNNKKGFSMPSHPLTNFEIQKYYQNNPRFNGAYSTDNLPEIKDGAYVNLDEYSDIRIHWIALYVAKASPKDVDRASPKDEQNNVVTYFDSFGVERIPKEIKKFADNKNRKNKYF